MMKFSNLSHMLQAELTKVKSQFGEMPDKALAGKMGNGRAYAIVLLSGCSD